VPRWRGLGGRRAGRGHSGRRVLCNTVASSETPARATAISGLSGARRHHWRRNQGVSRFDTTRMSTVEISGDSIRDEDEGPHGMRTRSRMAKGAFSAQDARRLKGRNAGCPGYRIPSFVSMENPFRFTSGIGGPGSIGGLLVAFLVLGVVPPWPGGSGGLLLAGARFPGDLPLCCSCGKPLRALPFDAHWATMTPSS
jgi:hypothetical protein